MYEGEMVSYRVLNTSSRQLNLRLTVQSSHQSVHQPAIKSLSCHLLCLDFPSFHHPRATLFSISVNDLASNSKQELRPYAWSASPLHSPSFVFCTATLTLTSFLTVSEELFFLLLQANPVTCSPNLSHFCFPKSIAVPFSFFLELQHLMLCKFFILPRL